MVGCNSFQYNQFVQVVGNGPPRVCRSGIVTGHYGNGPCYCFGIHFSVIDRKRYLKLGLAVKFRRIEEGFPGIPVINLEPFGKSPVIGELVPIGVIGACCVKPNFVPCFGFICRHMEIGHRFFVYRGRYVAPIRIFECSYIG